MNPFIIKSGNSTTILNQILTGDWLMSYAGLLQLNYFFKNVAGTQPHGQEKDRSDQMLSFYNEDLEKINPANVNEIPEGSVGVVNIIGPMLKYGDWFFWGADEIIYQLDFLNKTKSISSIIIKIDGPGGAVSAIPPFIDFAKRKNKPIVALCDASLSLHRWIPDAIADVQMAENNISARFGSVGVVSSWMDATNYYEKLGVKVHEVYADESEHKNEIVKAIRADEEKGYQMLRDMHLNPMAQKFQAAVKAAHPNLLEEEGVLTGRTYDADEALRIGFINKIGNIKEALLTAKALSEVYNFNPNIN